MTTDPRLEDYLTSMETALKPFPVSDRAEILTEIKSHVQATLERDPESRLDTVLLALGEPETVANRYLMERGLKPTKPSISPVVKWLVIGFLGTVAMVLLFLGVVITRFTPLLRVDDIKDKVSLFGGTIEVDGKNERVAIRGSWDGDSGGMSVGSLPMAKGESLAVNFVSAKIELNNASDAKLAWKCHGPGGGKNPEPKNENGEVKFDLSAWDLSRCEFAVPENVRLTMRGTSGKVNVHQPAYTVDIEMDNGKVGFEPSAGGEYRYSFAVVNGKMDTFTSSQKPEALDIKIRLKNGKITQLD
jgi:hypothetical protein